VTGLIVPPLDETPWSTLGPQICDLIEERCTFGPGDLRGEPAVIDDETRALIYRAYEVYPQGHPKAGRRRFKRVCISLRKGTAKTEKAAWIAFAELHPEGPVRCDGFDANGNPVGRPVRDPYIPMVAYTEEQTEELAYAALKLMCEESTDADLFDPTLERITRWNGDGKAVALAAAPNSRDGARTTFQHFDEPHRMTLPKLIDAHQTMLQNIPKRPIADPWSLSTTTAGVPGERSVAETEKDYAEKVHAGKARDPQLFYFHREASPSHDLETDEGLRAAIVEASGPAVAKWSDIDSIMSLYHQDDTDQAYFERVWLNRWVASSRQAFDPVRWSELTRADLVIADKEPIVLGFDGARWRDACGFVATHIETGHQWPIALWEKPEDLPKEVDWEVTDDQVNGALEEAMQRWRVVLLYADPPRFEDNVAKWAGKYGQKRVMEWYTNRQKQIGQAMRAYRTAMTSGQLSHSGDSDLARHIANARRSSVKVLDDDDTPLWTIYKERPDSEKYIDLAMAGCLSWQARLDALAGGNWQRRSSKMIVRRG
jgi:phage terminase large subunit-like protein